MLTDLYVRSNSHSCACAEEQHEAQTAARVNPPSGTKTGFSTREIEKNLKVQQPLLRNAHAQKSSTRLRLLLMQTLHLGPKLDSQHAKLKKNLKGSQIELSEEIKKMVNILLERKLSVAEIPRYFTDWCMIYYTN